ncbi:MAG: ring-1,2-phenylacetyl-CoA epoxidase subunit PaaA [Parcubacteria group bacterium Gr01-1014_48]|nr:MAG: ring-1,2-phenylacetyl-CoA epoxidase subunit PaaA [Parcubacteria group bacterium Greene0416_14]TSC73219.1 MAG: ring-1,2-phenylacetyl-CoA epoxidase subunit PaaA [Parcubacteria group bacterium Gr01-1014_48]TSD00483.1 MAG: ring-1,2-phenylacetyl-CoA epoxidase subunit PaaA [Parcubacteria group bacterium Greene1014_15]TSD08382.1 MAG: ring-1,2-phenylacetyl-CoA epoxidase subunit PaaA [Parcubacteria group bacterium Greene0714_4]
MTRRASSKVAEQKMFEKIQSGDPIEDASEMTPEYKEVLMHLLLMQADSELSGAYGYVPWIMRAPTVQEKLIVANIVKDEVRHAKAVFGLLADLGFDVQAHLDSQNLGARVSESDIGTKRAGTDMRVNIFYYPIETWTDFIMFNFCMDRGAGHQLGDVLTCSYGPWARVVQGIFEEEVTHIAHGDTWVKRLAQNPETHDECQEAFNKWYLRTLKIFGSDKSTKNELYRKLGLKKRTNSEVRNAFMAEVSQLATVCNLSMPGLYTPQTPVEHQK